MDKADIKSFSIWARHKLIADITYKAGLLGVTEEGIKDALPQSTQDAEFYDIGTKEPYAIHGEEIKQRKELVTAIKRKASQLDYKDAYRNVVEEVAYTWFNRLIAIRFMEVNDYMPAHIRVLSSDSKNKLEPDLVTTPFDAELEFTQAETEKIMQMKNDNQVDALFRFLFIKQCNALNTYLPKLFEKTSDYTELLLNVSVTDQDGIIYHLTHDINEDDFNISNIGEDGRPTGQVEIIGWMYQYYNTEPKDEAFALLKKNVKITKERIPAATQLFTPDWIVRYMVENSVGRLWLEGHEDNNLKNEWKYYLDEAEQEADVAEQLRAIREEYKNIKPEEIRVIDPCMGSGHILVYAFDVLMQIYERYGYSQRDAAKSIVENNIFGLDIDDRAFQLAYFAIMMKARSYNRRFLTLEIEPNLCAIQESNGLQYEQDMGDFLLSEEHRETLKYLLDTFVDAKEYGSILKVEKRDYDGFLEAWKLTAEATLGNVVMMLWYNECNQIVPVLAKQAKILAQKYEIVVSNPPYMSSGSMGSKLVSYVQKNYEKSKGDMYTVFIEKCENFLCKNGLCAMITQHSWMFLVSFEKIREKFFNNRLVNMIHLGARAFEEISGEVVQTVSFCFSKDNSVNYKSVFCRLAELQSSSLKEKALLSREKIYIKRIKQFEIIKGMPILYWAGDELLEFFKETKLGDIYDIKSGLSTGDNEIFVRYWFEVEKTKLSVFTGLEQGWIPYNKGGGVRKWYGLNYNVVNWGKDGNLIRNHGKAVFRNSSYYFREGVTWSGIASIGGTFRYCPYGFLFDSNKGPMIFECGKDIRLAMALLNSKVSQVLLSMLNPTLSLQIGDIASIPYVELEKEIEQEVVALVDKNIVISKQEWDSTETSWDFVRHPLLNKDGVLSEAYNVWYDEFCKMKHTLSNNEDKIDNVFLEKYKVDKDEVSSKMIEVPDREAGKREMVKSLISYAVGCMFGRYALNKDGLIYAGGDWDGAIYDRFMPDEDNIIPIVDEEYFTEDIVGKFCSWLKEVFGAVNFDENINFITSQLENKGNSPMDVLRNYFIKDFTREHTKMYQGKPIYWLFDSGKQNGFKALIYMHRYNADTIGNLRVDYLHRMERIYESEINRMQDTIDNSSNAREVTAAAKRKEKLQKQLKECQEYDEKIGHLALSRIDINLDDGVKVNYEKVQTANDGKKYQVLAKI